MSFDLYRATSESNFFNQQVALRMISYKCNFIIPSLRNYILQDAVGFGIAIKLRDIRVDCSSYNYIK